MDIDAPHHPSKYCKSNCGNGLLETGKFESCDDDNNFDGDGCSIQCVIEIGFECAGGAGSKSIC